MNPDSLQTVIDSLKKINESNYNDSLALYIAGVAVVVSAIVQIIVAFINKKQLNEQLKRQAEIAQKQIHANTVTENRKEWINEMRNVLAEFLSISSDVFFDLHVAKSKTFNEHISSSFPKLTLLKNKTELFLNPKEEISHKIIEGMSKVIGLIIPHKEEELNDVTNDFNNLYGDLLVNSKILLKDEWERVKLGD